MSNSEEPKRTILGTYMGIEFVESAPYVPDYAAELARTDPQARAELIIGRFRPGEAGMDTQNQPKEGPIAPPKGLTEGRMCHYVMPRGRHCAATVIEVEDRQTGTVDLAVFDSWSRSVHFFQKVAYDPLNHKVGTWHYIEPVVD